MAEFSLDEVFGASSAPPTVPGTQKEMGLDDVFGPPTLAATKVPQSVPRPQEASVSQVFDAPEPSTIATPSVVDYGMEFGKGVGVGATSNISSALKGAAAQASGPAIPSSMVTGPGEFAMLQEERAQQPLPPVQENPLYKAGQAVEDTANKIFPPGPGFEGSWTRDIGSGFGSVGGNIAMSMLSPGAAMLAMVNSGAGEATDNAIKAGATQDQIRRAASLGDIAGATDLVDTLLPSLGSTGKALGFIKKIGTRAIKGAFAEGGQEGVQQLIQNAISKGIYDPNKDLSEDVPRSVIIGAIVGGVATPALHGEEHGKTETASQAAINSAHATLVSSPVPQGPDPSTINTIPATPQQAPQSPQVPTPDTTKAAVTGAEDAVNVQPSSAIEQLLQQPPATPTEAHLRESSPLSSGANSQIAEVTPAILANDPERALTKSRLEMIPADQHSGEDVLAGADDLLSVTNQYDYPSGYLDAVPMDQRVSTKGVSHPGYRWEVINPDNPSKVLSVHESAPQARRAIDRRDNNYGAYKFRSRKRAAKVSELGPEETKFLQDNNFYNHIIGDDPDAKYNVSKLTPLAASQRGSLEEAVQNAFREFHQEQVNRQLVLAAVEQVAGKAVALRTQTPRQILLGNARSTVKGWGDTSQLPETSSGFYSPGAETRLTYPLLAVAVAGPMENAVTTAYHESWHAIEGTLTSEEVNTLRSETEPLRRFVQDKNPRDADLYARAEAEEIWAEAAAFYSFAQTMARTKIYNGPAATIFDKIQRLMEHIKRTVAALGFSKSGDIFESFYRGEMAERRAGMPVDMLERWWAREAGYAQAQSNISAELGRATTRNEAVLRKIDSGLDKAPAQVETLALRNGISRLYSMTHGSNAVPPVVTQALAHADVMAKRHKWFWGLDRLVDLNPRFTPLLRYAERIREMRTDAAKIQDRALRIAKDWRHLGAQMENLGQLIDHVANMNYRTPNEVARGVVRQPTTQEFQAAVTQYGVGNDALKVFAQQKRFFEGFLHLTTQNAMDEARRTISDPVALANKIVAIQTKEAQLLAKPYFPFLRYGLHYVTVKDATGAVVHFETFERKGLRNAESVQKAAEKFYTSRLQPGETISIGVLPETASPFIGLPPELLESIQKDLMGMPNAMGQSPGLTQDQINAIEQLRYSASPASSFAHRFQNKDYVKGYSDDFLRSFSRYAFHGARYYSRVKYGWALRGEIANARKLGKNASDNKIGSIANYMDDHLHNTVLDAKGDFGWAKGGIFLWVFGYSVAGATLNLSQVPMVTYPWMAAKFGGFGVGDKRATGALLRAGTQLQNFYKKGAYSNQTAFEMRAIDYGVRSGRISESQASELAGLAQGSTLLGLGNNKASRGLQQLIEKGTWFFEMAEQYNRRVTYRAALELAQKFPQSKAVNEAMGKYADEYAQLVQSGFAPTEARSVVTAVHATEQTQFVYARENRPRFMRGRLAGTILVFKTYLLNVLQLMGADKSSILPRQMMMLLLMGGLMGLPGAEDLEDIINVLSKWLFGKDFNVQRQLREFLVEAVGDKADVVLHGLSRRGFGIPALLDLLGEAPGRGLGSGPGNNVPVPVLDRSKAISAGRILPFELGKVLDPTDVDKEISAQTQNASGAVFGVGFNLYRALMDESTAKTDVKRWERAMPRALASTSRAYRAFEEGRSRGKGGPNSAPTIVPFDTRDTEQMAEVIAMGLGYTPLRLSAKWDSIMAEAEVEKKLQIEQKIIIQQRFEAGAGGKDEEIERANDAIAKYNDGLPDWARGYKITGDSLYSSLQARERDRNLKEAGIPAQARNRPVAEYIQGLFPESVVDVRKVR